MIDTVFLLVLGVSSGLALKSGPVGNIQFTSVDACKEANNQMNIELDSSDPDGKTFNVQFNLARPFNADWQRQYNAEIVYNSSPASFATKTMVSICDTMREEVPNFWDRILKELGTDADSCSFTSGAHELKNLKFKEEDIATQKDLPYGHFNITVQWFDDTNVLAACFVFCGDHTPLV